MIEMVTQYSLTKLKLKQLTLLFFRWFCSFLFYIAASMNASHREQMCCFVYVFTNWYSFYCAHNIEYMASFICHSQMEKIIERAHVCEPFIDGNDRYYDRCLKQHTNKQTKNCKNFCIAHLPCIKRRFCQRLIFYDFFQNKFSFFSMLNYFWSKF